jgi:hypothetical protein
MNYYQTAYYGISIAAAYLLGYGWRYWIVDDRGGEQYIGADRPTVAQVDAYARSL